MKKVLKRILCVFLAVLILVTCYVTYYFSTYFRYWLCFKSELKEDFLGTFFIDYPMWEFYSKTPKWYTVSEEKAKLDLEGAIFYATYLGDLRSSGDCEYFYFKNKGLLSRDGIASEYGEIEYGDVFKVVSACDIEENIFYSRITTMFAYYGVKFEFGKDYLVFCYFSPLYTMFFDGICYAPLDGEYPYIEVYPGATRYDATYFGAETKYVTKEEFIELVKQENDRLNNEPRVCY